MKSSIPFELVWYYYITLTYDRYFYVISVQLLIVIEKFKLQIDINITAD